MTACDNCGAPIRGYYWGDEPSTKDVDPPNFCLSCGVPYPWTESGLEAARELAREADGLDEDERALLERSLDDIVSEGPKTGVAVERTKRLLAKAGKGTAQAIRDILVDIASQAAKKSLGL
jgi:hypothetical protein